jgi:hypothetical protein
LCIGYAQCHPQRIAIFCSENISHILLKFLFSGIKNENTATLSSVFGQINFTLSDNSVNFGKQYFTISCSCFRIVCIHHIDSIYSNDFNKLTAQIIFGVHASNFDQVVGNS